MRIPTLFGAGLVSTCCLAPHASAGINSQLLDAVEALPVAISQIIPCGSWEERGQSGYYLIVLAEVINSGSTEVYIQQVLHTMRSDRELRVVSTTPVRELNDDHSQYHVSATQCLGRNTLEMKASNEHDEHNRGHRIRLVLSAPGKYRVSDVVVPAAKRR